MSFRLLIYYFALAGGWAAFGAWALVQLAEVGGLSSSLARATVIGAFAGTLVAVGVGFVDGLLSASARSPLWRGLACSATGLAGGALGGWTGEFLHGRAVSRALGWVIVGAAVGASVAAYDLARAIGARRDPWPALRKLRNGVAGGCIGGLLGALLFSAVFAAPRLPQTALALGLVAMGTSIGLFIGLAQVLLQTASVKVEKGFLAGREMILTKERTVIGRAETSDIGLYGDAGVERVHACIVRAGDHYEIEDAGTQGGTFVNGKRVRQPLALGAGDRIAVGASVLRFEERRRPPAPPPPAARAVREPVLRG